MKWFQKADIIEEHRRRILRGEKSEQIVLTKWVKHEFNLHQEPHPSTISKIVNSGSRASHLVAEGHGERKRKIWVQNEVLEESLVKCI